MSEERVMWERVDSIIVEALATAYEAGQDSLGILEEPDSADVLRKLIAELREPGAAMVEAGARVMFDDEVGELERRIFTDAWRAAIDAISGGEG